MILEKIPLIYPLSAGVSFTLADEGKVVSNGALVSQTSVTVTDNGTYDTALNNLVIVAIPTAEGVWF